jgi:hypothetical protein
MTDIAASLATDFVTAQGYACIHIAPQTAAAEVVVTVADIGARDESS